MKTKKFNSKFQFYTSALIITDSAWNHRTPNKLFFSDFSATDAFDCPNSTWTYRNTLVLLLKLWLI